MEKCRNKVGCFPDSPFPLLLQERYSPARKFPLLYYWCSLTSSFQTSPIHNIHYSQIHFHFLQPSPSWSSFPPYSFHFPSQDSLWSPVSIILSACREHSILLGLINHIISPRLGRTFISQLFSSFTFLFFYKVTYSLIIFRPRTVYISAVLRAQALILSLIHI